jgi:transposase InsO family protein
MMTCLANFGPADLDRQGQMTRADRMYRLWRQEALQVPKKRPCRRVASSRPRPLPPTAVNHVWAHDFVFDEVRPHSSLAYLTPAAFKAKHLADVDGGRSPAMPARADVAKNGELRTGPISAILQ